MRMKQPLLPTRQDTLKTGRIRESETTPITIFPVVVAAGLGTSVVILRVFRGGTDDGNAFGEHDLVAGVGVEVAAAHETGLGRVSVDPAEDHEVSVVDIVEQGAFVFHLARVGRRDLGRDDKVRDEERVGDQGSS